MRWYRFDSIDGVWKCNHCEFQSKSSMGISSHIRKHKSDKVKSEIMPNLFSFEKGGIDNDN